MLHSKTYNMNLRKLSYILFFGFLVFAACFQLATPTLAIFFAYFALSRFSKFVRKGVSVILLSVLVLGIFYGMAFFIKASVKTLPRIAETSVPLAIDYAAKKGFELPFTDVESLKVLAVSQVQHGLGDLAKFTQVVTKEFVFVIIGLIIAISIFLNGKIDLGHGTYAIENNLYSKLSEEVAARFIGFYNSFATVIGAQLAISAINTAFTAVFTLVAGVPHAHIVVVITFLCGLLPIIGNLISNTIICGVAVTKSPELAIVSLLYLVMIHKVEYFLNSKIIGGRIKNPMWLTLLGLIIGERIMGIPGMILAPVVLYYLKIEGSRIEVKKA